MCRRWLGGGPEGERVLVKCGMGCGGEMGWGVLEWGGGEEEAWLKEGYLFAEPFVCNGC